MGNKIRKDKSGVLLQENESQRKNGKYQFRFTDERGNRNYIYAKSLTELREMEAEIKNSLAYGIDFSESNITVSNLLDRYLLLRKRKVRYSTYRTYSGQASTIKKTSLGNVKIKNVTFSISQKWALDMSEGRNPRGKEYSVDAICGFVTLLRLAFEEAYKDNLVIKNPFDFSVRRLLNKEEDKPRVITEEQYQELMEFIINDKTYSDLYYPLALAHETGLRAGEVLGLTVDDVDFQNQVLHVSRQIVFGPGRTYCITGPKSKAGNRYVPLSFNAMQILHAAIEDVKARKVNPCIDGIVGFLFIRKNGNVYVSEVYCDRVRRAMEKYRKINPSFPHFKSHMLRHMFCDNLNESGVSIKTAQYIMGHAKADTTANIYMQANRENAIADYRNKLG